MIPCISDNSAMRMQYPIVGTGGQSAPRNAGEKLTEREHVHTGHNNDCEGVKQVAEAVRIKARLDEELAGCDQGVCVGCRSMRKVQDTYRVSEAQAKSRKLVGGPTADREGGRGSQANTTLGSQRAQHHDSHQRSGEELAEQRVRTEHTRLTCSSVVLWSADWALAPGWAWDRHSSSAGG